MNVEERYRDRIRTRSYWLATLLAIATLIFSIALPLVSRLTTEYAAPTAFYALQAARSGILATPHLPNPPSPNSYWQGNVETEVQFPIPALLLAVFFDITGIPADYVMFIPIVGLAGIIYFVMARHVLSMIGQKKLFTVLLPSIYYCFISISNIATGYVGRATLGVIFLSYLLFAYLLFFEGPLRGSHTRAWFVISVLLIIVISLTYYVSSLAVFTASFLLVASSFLFPILRKRGTALTIISTVALIYGPFAFLVTRVSGELTLEAFVNNVILFWATTLRIDIGPQINAISNSAVNVSIYDRITSDWFGYLLRLLSIIATVWAFLKYRRNLRAGGNRTAGVLWLFSSIIIFLSISELGYLFVAPVEPTRFISMYGLILLLVFLGIIIRNESKLRFGSTLKQVSLRKILAVLLILILALNAHGVLRFTWYRDNAKPYAYQTVYPATKLLLSHSASAEPIGVTGDADYLANVFFITATNNGLGSVGAEPLEEHTATLYSSALGQDMSPFLSAMHQKDVSLLLFVTDGRPIWGDEWGYRFSIDNLDSQRLTLIYNDGLVQVFSLG